MESSAYSKKFNLRLPPEVFDKISRLGKNSERSVNEQMVYMLKTWQDPAIIKERIAQMEKTDVFN